MPYKESGKEKETNGKGKVLGEVHDRDRVFTLVKQTCNPGFYKESPKNFNMKNI